MDTFRPSAAGAASALPFAFPSLDWSKTFEEDCPIEGKQTFHTDVFRSGTLICRIAFAGQFADRAAAEEAGITRLVKWLTDYQSRPMVV